MPLSLTQKILYGLYAPTAAPAAGGEAPVNLTPPSISDMTPTEGLQLTVDRGVWDGDTPMTFDVELRYVSDDSVVAEDTDTFNYTPDANDVGEAFYAHVAATNAVDTVTAESGDTAAVEAAAVAPEITTLSLPNPEVGVAYSQTPTATGDAPITWSVTSGSLPAGLSLNASTGEISGTPTTYTGLAEGFTLTATNDAGSDDQAYSVTVAFDPVTAYGANIVRYWNPNVSTLYQSNACSGDLAVDTDEVLCMEDLSASSANATGSSASVSPVLDTSDPIFGNTASLNYATSRFLMFSSLSLTGNFHVYGVFSNSDLSGVRPLIGLSSLGSMRFYIASTTITVTVITDLSSQDQMFTGSAISLDTPHLIEVELSGNTMTCWVDGVQYGSPTTVTVAGANRRVTYDQIGRRATSTYFNGKIGSILIANEAQGGTQKQANLRAFFTLA